MKELQYVLNVMCNIKTHGMEWDTFKAQARRLLSSKINRFKMSSKLILPMTTDKLLELENAYALDPNSDNLQKVKLQTRVINNIHIEKARLQVFFFKQRVYEHGEQAGKLLAYLAHLNDKPPVVVSLLTPQGDTVTDSPQVAARFQ